MPGSIGSRIAWARKAKKLKQKEVADLMGTDPSSISRWEKDKQGISFDNASSLARILGVSVQFLNTGEDESIADPDGSKLLPVVGEVQAGIWREAVEWAPEDQYTIPVFLPPKYRDLVMSVYVVRGTSMNMFYPNGAHVVVASTIANGLSPRHGNRVLVSRTSRDGLHEATLKEYVVDKSGKIWLRPRSTDPQHQTPIAYRDNDTEEVTITGIVALVQILEEI